MAVTPYLRLQKPPFDTIPWDQAINGNMDILDSTIAQFLSVPGYTGTWANATSYTSGQVVLDAITATMWQCLVSHTSAVVPTTFAQDRTAHPTYWLNTTTAPVAPVDQHNVGRNLLHNPLFNVAQRGTGPFTVVGMTLDRWSSSFSGGTVSIVRVASTDALKAAVGDEAAAYVLTNTFTGSAAAGSYAYMSQTIEDVRRLTGKTVTISFWAGANSGTPKLGVSLDQYFGTGGSPSASVNGAGVTVTLSTTMTRYSITLTLPSGAGKTVGTNNDHGTYLILWCSAEATFATRSGGVGVQSNGFSIWGVQLEIGNAATPLEKPDPRYDLSNCERFCQVVPVNVRANVSGAVPISGPVYCRTAMRAVPTTNTYAVGSRANVAGITLTMSNYLGGRINCTSSAGGDAYILDEFWILSADL